MKASLSLGCITLVSLVLGLRSDDASNSTTPAPAVDTYRMRFETVQARMTASGATACMGSVGCHKGGNPLPEMKILGDEWERWDDGGKGVHVRAFKVLSEDDRSDRMAKRLYGADVVAKERQECIACHALDVPKDLRDSGFRDNEEGVSCEACHGRSGKWFGEHKNAKRWREDITNEQRTALGYYDTRNLIRRAEKCLECHLGTEDKQVTHAMMAAGHPALTFELAGDLADVPKHWRNEQSYLSADEGTWFHTRVWAVGQAVALRETMLRLSRWSSSSHSADYALFECYQCHHDLKTSSWRQADRKFLRTPGEPVWDVSSWEMCRPIIAQLMSKELQGFERNVKVIIESLSVVGGDRAKVRSAANELATLADKLARKAERTKFDAQRTRAILLALTARRDYIGDLGYQAAAQTYLALDALYRLAYAPTISDQGDESSASYHVISLHDELFEYDEVLQRAEQPKSAEYDARKFRKILKDFEAALGKP